MRRTWKLAAVAATSAALGLAALTTSGSAHDADDEGGMGMMRGGGMGMMREGGMGMMGGGGMGMMGGGGMGMMGGHMHMFEMLDTNKDGSVAADEAHDAMLEQLKKFDANGDGNLSLEEFAAMWAAQTRPMMVRRFQFHDEDGDGKVTPEEMTAPFERMLRMMDRNGDGQLGPDDMRGGTDDQGESTGKHRH